MDGGPVKENNKKNMDGQLSNKHVRGWISRRQIKGRTMEVVYEILADGRYIYRRLATIS